MDEATSRWVDALKGQVEPWELAELEDPAGKADAFSRDATFGTGGIRPSWAWGRTA